MSALEQPFMTIEEYYALEEKSLVKHEYYNGRRWPLGQPYGPTPEAMAGGSHAHARIGTNAAIALGSSLRDKPYEVINTDQMVKIEASGLQTYPDVSVYCHDARFEGSKDQSLLNPKVILEVLSPSTQDYDRSDKFEHYKLIPTLTHYLLISQERIWVEHYARIESGWLRHDYWDRDAMIPLPHINVELPLDELYKGLNLPAGLLVLPSSP